MRRLFKDSFLVVVLPLFVACNSENGSSLKQNHHQAIAVSTSVDKVLAFSSDTLFVDPSQAPSTLPAGQDQVHQPVTAVSIDGRAFDLGQAMLDVAVRGDLVAAASNNSLVIYKKQGKLKTMAEMQLEVGQVKEVILSPNGQYVYVLDGGTDQILCFSINEEKQSITPLDRVATRLRGGCQAVDFDWHPDGQRWYALCSEGNMILAGSFIDSLGYLQLRSSLQSSPLKTQGNLTTDMTISQDGRFLYVWNRDLGTVGLYSLDRDMSFSFLQFLQLPKGSEASLVAEGNTLLIGHHASDKVYQAIHKMDQKLMLADSLEVVGLERLVPLRYDK